VTDLDAVEELGILVLRLDGVQGGVGHLVPEQTSSASDFSEHKKIGRGDEQGRGGRGLGGTYFRRALPTWKLIQKLRKA
jgi:hypothetical protein